ncbi:MAG: hypothetical protein GY854_22620 [Deltaproteobacteria bacterium]|nr:hypothetical protein [Deltaproteobacteria bacterium]
MIRWALMAVGMFLLMACSGAQPGGTPHMHQLESDTLEMWVSTGNDVLPIYIVEGQHYLHGTEGDRYEIGLTNRTDSRLEAVVSVDGRDVITGRPADYRNNRGYVVLPGEEIRIEGFRTNLDEVAAFEFSTPEESYAARRGDASNIGVIGVAVFVEEPQEKKVIATGGERADAPQTPVMADAKADKAAEEEAGLGTKYGDGVSSIAEIVPFQRHTETEPQEIMVLYYDNRAGLEGIGVVFPEEAPKKTVSNEPNPFPAATDKGQGFAPPPPH